MTKLAAEAVGVVTFTLEAVGRSVSTYVKTFVKLKTVRQKFFYDIYASNEEPPM